MKDELDVKSDELVENEEEGASMVEYALLVALIAVIAILAIQILGKRVSQSFSRTASAINTTA